MVNWQIKQLNDLCEILIGGTPSRGVVEYWKNGTLPWVSIRDMSREGDVIENTNEKITERGAKESNVKLIPKGSLLFSFKLSIGKLALAGSDLYTNEAIAALVIKDEKQLDKNFLRYYISQMVFDDVTTAVKGGTLNKEKIKNLEIPLPPLATQQKIVAQLDELLGNIAQAKQLRQEAIADTEKILSQTLREIFEEGKEKGWDEKKIGEVFVLTYGKGLSKDERSPTGKYSVYGANGELGKSDKFLINSEGIIVGRKGSAGEITRVSGKYWPTDVTYFVLESENYNIDFAFYLFKYLDFTQYAKGVKPGINRNEIYDLNFYFPPLPEQHEIVTRLDALSIKLRELRQLQAEQLEDLKKLEKAYLREAFNGELC